MTYKEAIAWLASIEGLGIKLALRNITAVLGALGRPQLRFASVLVAGSNGKGSVAAMLESILRHAGQRTGLYTSPHLVRHEERIQIEGRPVSEKAFAGAIDRVRAAAEALTGSGSLEAHPTHFETLTAAAFDLFARSGVELAVLEVGMGGRLDATVLSHPRLALLTNVSLEHTQWLGGTIAEIAREKAGVLLREGTLLAAETHPDVLEACRARASEVGGTFVPLDDEARLLIPDGTDLLDVQTSRRAHHGLRASLHGPFQRRNALLAVAASDVLDGMGFAVPARAVADGLASASWPGRFQVVEGDPPMILDGAHNPAACDALREALESWPGAAGGPRTILLGVLRDKNARARVRELSPAADRIVVTRGTSSRFRDPWALAEELRAEGIEAQASGDLAEGLKLATESTRGRGTLIVTGSLYLVGDVMRLLELEPWPARRDARAAEPVA